MRKKSVVREGLRSVLDYLVEAPLMLYLLALGFALLLSRLPRTATSAFVESSLPAMASVAFSLFSAMVVALSILTSLKATPFFDVLQRRALSGKRGERNTWRDLVGAFLHLAGIFAVLGAFSISITKDRILSLASEPYVVVVFFYLALVVLAFSATVIGLYLLRLVAIVPPPEKEKKADHVDPSFLKAGSSEQEVVDLSSS